MIEYVADQSDCSPQTSRKKFVLRAATAGDITDIASLHASRFDRGWSESEISAFFKDPVNFILVAESEKPGIKLAGLIIARAAAGEAEILTLATSHGLERHGIGTALVEYACKTAASRSAGSIFLEVASVNTAACALYQRCDFTKTARRAHYYGKGQNDDAIIMCRDLCHLVDAGT